MQKELEFIITAEIDNVTSFLKKIEPKLENELRDSVEAYKRKIIPSKDVKKAVDTAKRRVSLMSYHRSRLSMRKKMIGYILSIGRFVKLFKDVRIRRNNYKKDQ